MSLTAELCGLLRDLESPKNVWLARTADGKYLRGLFEDGDHWMLGFLSEWGCRKHAGALHAKKPEFGPYAPQMLTFDEAMDIVRSIAKRHDVSGLRVFDATGNLAGETWVR